MCSQYSAGNPVDSVSSQSSIALRLVWPACYFYLPPGVHGPVFFQVCNSSGNLAHLGKLFEMYVDKSYHRPRSTWLDSVCRYINDSFGHLTRSHITFLLEVRAYHGIGALFFFNLLGYIVITQPQLNRFVVHWDLMYTLCTVLNYIAIWQSIEERGNGRDRASLEGPAICRGCSSKIVKILHWRSFHEKQVIL